MRLKSIKLAGFKSFVDPTTVSFPSNLCAVVGPNGCGKSNIIDAVRWVMGESSAKQLRGESMTDVIFNGSGGRKPVGQASIELIFDNSDGKVVGEYAGYAEISVRRKVTRDSQNIYYLNSTKCRRKDITDLFLGTGLGPRSYAIIEQGMISNLIEAKPDDLRTTIEEAAGISKYKERRRETENRMSRTKENLERLTDIREELERGLNRLQRQAKAAEKYAEYKKEERWLKAQQLTILIRQLDERAAITKNRISELELSREAVVTERVAKETEIEQFRSEHITLNDKFNEVQGRYYAAGADIARVEQSIQHTQERDQQLKNDLTQVLRELTEAEENLGIDRNKSTAWQAELLEIEPELKLAVDAEGESSAVLLTAEDAMHEWQTQWDSFNEAATLPQQNSEVQQSRIQQIEKNQVRLLARVDNLKQEQAGLTGQNDDGSIELLQAQLSDIEEQMVSKREALTSLGGTLDNQRQQQKTQQAHLNELRGQLQQQRGRAASLETLQQAATRDSSKALSHWLEQQGLTDNPRLLETLTTEPGWEKAVEVVLGDSLQSICVDQLDAVANSLDQLNEGNLLLLEKTSAISNPAAMSLAGKVKVNGPWGLPNYLGDVFVADSLSQAMSMRTELNDNQSVVTRDGLWLSRSWLRVSKGVDTHAGVLERQQQLNDLQEQIAIDQAATEQAILALDDVTEEIKHTETEQARLREELEAISAQHSGCHAEFSAKKVRIEENQNRKKRIYLELQELANQLDSETTSLQTARVILEESIAKMEENNIERDRLMGLRDGLRADLDQARQRARHDKDKHHELALRFQSVETQLNSIRESINRLEQQSVRLIERRENLQTGIEELVEPLAASRVELDNLLEGRLAVERELEDARRKLEEVEHQLREAEKARNLAEENVRGLQEELEKVRIDAQTYNVQRENNLNQLAAESYTFDAVQAQMPADLTVDDVNQLLEQQANRINRLGPINLAAIDEYKIESERKIYLDAQNEDLCTALATLEDAIRKIDQDTRNRFKETFEQVNNGLQELFPKVFGGGSARLDLTSDDLLETGIVILAQPPGKRNSTIHLLSGGEKALTAIALVFSIFRLNPAPFCMLDEVDAPLDDINTGRYANMVKEMSNNVQFIYITHNKISMEIADQLMGVTMHEPGVSRMVTVDVDEAAQLAVV